MCVPLRIPLERRREEHQSSKEATVIKCYCQLRRVLQLVLSQIVARAVVAYVHYGDHINISRVTLEAKPGRMYRVGHQFWR